MGSRNLLILTVLQGPDKGRRFELPDDEPQLLGRSSEAVPISDPTMSRRHSELTPDDGLWYLNDLDSSNGTYLNGVRLTARRPLEPGDQFRIGNTLILFGTEASGTRQYKWRIAGKDELQIQVEHVASSNDESMIMAVPDPSEEAVMQLTVIYELTELIGSIVDRGELLQCVMDLIFEHFHADRGFISLKRTTDDAIDPVVERQRIVKDSSEQTKAPISRTIVNHVIKHGEGVLSSNAMTDERFAGGDSIQDMAIHSAICVPIKYKDRLFGVIHLDSQITNYTFTEDQLRLLTAIGVHTGLALSNAHLYERQLQRERLAAVGQTVASLSHSVRNMLQGLRGGADVLELGLKKNKMEVIRGGWDIVSRNLDRIYSLTMNMLAYSKQRQPEIEMTILNSVVEEVITLMQHQFDDKHVALIADLDQDMPPVPLDASGIHQALLNLINNALEAVDRESGTVTVGTAFDPVTQQATIRVVDSGAGISPESRKYLFIPFHSTKGLRGTGLGLVVTKKICEEHGGSLSVRSSPTKGSMFTIALPVTTDNAPTAADTQGLTSVQKNPDKD